MRDKDVTFDEIEELTRQVMQFVKDKDYEILDEFDFMTRVEGVLQEEIKKYYEGPFYEKKEA